MKKKLSYYKREMPISIQQISREYIYQYLDVKITAKEITQEQYNKFMAAVKKALAENSNSAAAFAAYRKEFCGMFEEFKHLLVDKNAEPEKFFGELKAGFNSEE